MRKSDSGSDSMSANLWDLLAQKLDFESDLMWANLWDLLVRKSVQK